MRLPNCPRSTCNKLKEGRTDRAGAVKFGSFYRRGDSKRVQRFRCNGCRRTFSTATDKDTFKQKKRRINGDVRALLCMKVNMRTIAEYLGVDRKTVTHRLQFFARRARRYLATLPDVDLEHVMFDELQTSVVTKCKPVAIPLAVDVKTRRILAVAAASMPAQPPLVENALAKYGPRNDDRPAAIDAVLARVAPLLSPRSQISTDAALRYPEPIRRLLPGVLHNVYLSRNARTGGGQGELKKIGLDPLFTLNHTAAMKRDRISRLVRRTWANSKRLDRLEDHLYVYAHFHNEIYLPKRTR